MPLKEEKINSQTGNDFLRFLKNYLPEPKEKTFGNVYRIEKQEAMQRFHVYFEDDAFRSCNKEAEQKA